MEQLMQRPIAIAVVTLALAGPAAAQTTAPPPTTAPNSAQTQYHRPAADDQRASKLIGTSVRNNAGETIGNINEVLLSRDGRVTAVVIGVGGFLGIGEREIAVSFGSLQLTRDTSDRTVAMLPGATKESLKSAPEWKWPTRS
jgi:hypothetical protein